MISSLASNHTPQESKKIVLAELPRVKNEIENIYNQCEGLFQQSERKRRFLELLSNFKKSIVEVYDTTRLTFPYDNFAQKNLLSNACPNLAHAVDQLYRQTKDLSVGGPPGDLESMLMEVRRIEAILVDDQEVLYRKFSQNKPLHVEEINKALDEEKLNEVIKIFSGLELSTRPNCYLSFSEFDRELVEFVSGHLKRAGVKIDTSFLLSVDRGEQIERCLEADYLIVLGSVNYGLQSRDNNSVPLVDEARYARERSGLNPRSVVRILINGSPFTSFPPLLNMDSGDDQSSKRTYVDLRKPDEYLEGLLLLLQHLYSAYIPKDSKETDCVRKSILSAKISSKNIDKAPIDILAPFSLELSRVYSQKETIERFHGSGYVRVPIEPNFVTLEMCERNKFFQDDKEKLVENLPIEEDDKEKLVENLPIEALLDHAAEGDSHTLLFGPAGVGKTTLIHFLVHRWSRGSDREVIPIWIPLREVNDKDGSIGEFICRYYRLSKRISPTEIDRWITADSSRFCLLLDGWDEISFRSKTSNSRTIIERLLLSCKNWVVVSRPGYQSDDLFRSARHIEIKGFSQEMVMEYVKKYSASHQGSFDINHFNNVLQGHPMLKGMASHPMHLELICGIFGNDPESLTSHSSFTDLYLIVIGESIRGYFAKWQNRPKIRRAEVWKEPYACRMIEMIAASSWEMFTKNEVNFKLSESLITSVEEKERESFFNGLLEQLGLLVPTSMEINIEDRVYEFRHLTFQYFFVGYYLAQAWKQDSSVVENWVNEHILDSRIAFVLPFATGILGFQCGSNEADRFLSQLINQGPKALPQLHLAALCYQQVRHLNCPTGELIRDGMSKWLKVCGLRKFFTVFPYNQTHFLFNRDGNRKDDLVEEAVAILNSGYSFSSTGLRKFPLIENLASIALREPCLVGLLLKELLFERNEDKDLKKVVAQLPVDFPKVIEEINLQLKGGLDERKKVCNFLLECGPRLSHSAWTTILRQLFEKSESEVSGLRLCEIHGVDNELINNSIAKYLISSDLHLAEASLLAIQKHRHYSSSAVAYIQKNLVSGSDQEKSNIVNALLRFEWLLLEFGNICFAQLKNAGPLFAESLLKLVKRIKPTSHSLLNEVQKLASCEHESVRMEAVKVMSELKMGDEKSADIYINVLYLSNWQNGLEGLLHVQTIDSKLEERLMQAAIEGNWVMAEKLIELLPKININPSACTERVLAIGKKGEESLTERALQVISHLKVASPTVHHAVASSLLSSNEPVRKAALRALKEIEPIPQDVVALQLLSQLDRCVDDAVGDHIRALKILRINQDDLVTQIVLNFTRGNEVIQRRLFWAIRAFLAAIHGGDLIRLLGNEDPQLSLLATILFNSSEIRSNQWKSAWDQLLFKGRVRDALCLLWASLPNNELPALDSLFEQNDWQVKKLIVRILPELSISPEESEKIILSALQNQDSRVREEALFARHRMYKHSDQLMKSLSWAFTDKEWTVRRAVCWLITDLPAQEILPLVIPLLSDVHPLVVLEALKAGLNLGEPFDAKLVASWLKFLTHPDAEFLISGIDLFEKFKPNDIQLFDAVIELAKGGDISAKLKAQSALKNRVENYLYKGVGVKEDIIRAMEALDNSILIELIFHRSKEFAKRELISSSLLNRDSKDLVLELLEALILAKRCPISLTTSICSLVNHQSPDVAEEAWRVVGSFPELFEDLREVWATRTKVLLTQLSEKPTERELDDFFHKKPCSDTIQELTQTDLDSSSSDRITRGLSLLTYFSWSDKTRIQVCDLFDRLPVDMQSLALEALETEIESTSEWTNLIIKKIERGPALLQKELFSLLKRFGVYSAELAPSLLALLEHPDPKTQSRFLKLKLFSNIEHLITIEILEALLKHPSPKVILKALQILDSRIVEIKPVILADDLGEQELNVEGSSVEINTDGSVSVLDESDENFTADSANTTLLTSSGSENCSSLGIANDNLTTASTEELGQEGLIRSSDLPITTIRLIVELMLGHEDFYVVTFNIVSKLKNRSFDVLNAFAERLDYDFGCIRSSLCEFIQELTEANLTKILDRVQIGTEQFNGKLLAVILFVFSLKGFEHLTNWLNTFPSDSLIRNWCNEQIVLGSVISDLMDESKEPANFGKLIPEHREALCRVLDKGMAFDSEPFPRLILWRIYAKKAEDADAFVNGVKDFGKDLLKQAGKAFLVAIFKSILG